jgi:hypothetical protein
MKKVLAVSLIAVIALLLIRWVLASAVDTPRSLATSSSRSRPILSPIERDLSNAPRWGSVHYFGSATKTGWESGKVAHFYEDFVIYPETGGYIKGYDDGLWTFPTWKFRAEGRVTEASSEWSHLVGYKFHEMGTTDDPTLLPTDPDAEWVLNGPSTMFLAGP